MFRALKPETRLRLADECNAEQRRSAIERIERLDTLSVGGKTPEIFQEMADEARDRFITEYGVPAETEPSELSGLGTR